MTIDTTYLDADTDKIKLARQAILDMAHWINDRGVVGRVVDSISDLRALDKTKNTRAFATGYYDAGDGGGGPYWYDSTDTTSADNSGTVIVATDGGRWKLAQQTHLSVRQFGAKGDGIADDTVAIQAAINSLSSGRGTVFFPAGVYKVTSTITVSQHRVHLVGAGSWATQVLFAPTAAGACFKFSAGAYVLFQGSVKGLSFYSHDATYKKTAIEIVDVSGYLVDDIVIGGSVVVSGSTFWSGASSVGIQVKGREACKFSRLYLYADIPLQISNNPNSSIDIDHFHFEDTYLAANGNPCVTIDSGVNLTNVTFDGYNAWVLGTDGLRWVDTTSTGVSQTLTLRGVRFEQGTDPTAWCVDIQHNYVLQCLSIEDCQGGFERNGIRLRKVDRCSLRNNINSGGAGRTVLDVDASVKEIDIRGCLWQSGASAVMTGQTMLWGGPKAVTGAPLPPTAYYSVAVEKRIETAAANGGYIVTVPNNGVVGLGSNLMAGMLTVIDSEYLSAIYNVRGTLSSVLEVSDPSGVFTAAAGSAGYTNVYWSAANSRYEIENKRGAERRYMIVLDGTYSSF